MARKIFRQFGNKVKKLREAKGWTQEELAKRTGLHRTYIGSIERSERNVSLINVDRIAKSLNVPAEFLLKK